MLHQQQGVFHFFAPTSTVARGVEGRRRRKGLCQEYPEPGRAGWVLLEGLGRQSGSSSRGMRQPIHPHAPDGEESAGVLQSLLTLCLPTLCTQSLPMSQCCFPGVLPLAIAHGIA
jgi:hypothetical protein